MRIAHAATASKTRDPETQLYSVWWIAEQSKIALYIAVRQSTIGCPKLLQEGAAIPHSLNAIPDGTGLASMTADSPSPLLHAISAADRDGIDLWCMRRFVVFC